MGMSGLREAQGLAAHVLIVDDEPLAALALRELLEWRGYRVTTAPDGLEALDVWAAEPVDLLITDLNMPRMDGATLVQRLRELTPRLPVIVMTGQVPASVLAELQGKAAPAATRLVLKPISPPALMQEIEAALRIGRGLPCAPDALAHVAG